MKQRRHTSYSKMSVIYRLLVFLFSFCTTFLAGNANAASASTPKWQPYIDIQGKAGNERSLGRASLFLPVNQGDERLLFLDARFVLDDNSATEGNLGLAYRHRFGDVMQGGIFGVYGFIDYRKSENDFGYRQLTGGVEWLANDWEARANIYAPEDEKNSISSSFSNEVALNGTTAVYRTGVQSFLEQALPGFDVEAGYRFGVNARSNLWLHGGYFKFDDAGVPEVAGPRVRLEYRLQDPFGWKGSELGLGLEGQDDNVRGSQGFATARLRIPLGKVNKGKPALVGLDRRMVNPIQRDVDVVTTVGDTPVEEIASETPITDPGSGEVINVYFVEENGSGDCSQANPCVVSSAQGDAVYGIADIIVPLADSGIITSDILLTQPRQQVVGGGDTGSAVLSLSTGDPLLVSGLGARPRLAARVSMTDASFVAGFDIDNGNTAAAITGNGVNSATVRDINVLGSGGAGIEFVNAGGAISIENSSASNAVGAGLRISGGDATMTLTNFDISDTASGRSLDIQGTSGGSVSFDPASSISNSGGSGILVDNIGGNVTFNGAVNISGASSDAITATNLNTNTVAFTGALAITTANGHGLTASNGILNIAGTGTTINASNGSALDLNTVDVGNGSGGALSFASLASNDGATGINLNGVTASNGLTVNNAVLSNNSIAGLAINDLTGTLDFNGTTNIDASGNGVSIAGTNGTVNLGVGAGNSLSIDGGTTGIVLAGTGTVNMGTNGGSASIGTSTSTGSHAIAVAGGVIMNYAGNITQNNNAALLNVSGGHNGSLNFDTGTLSASNGSGLQFDNADGSYTFNATTILNGGDAGIDIVNGSSGDFNFGTAVSITNPTGTAFHVDGSNGAITYNGTLTNTTGRSVVIQNRSGGNVTLAGNISDAGTGLLAQNNVGGSANFTGAINSTAVDLNNNASAINFSGALSLTDGLVLSNNDTSTIGFNSLNISGAAIGVLADNRGDVTVSGTTTISNAASAAIRLTSGGTDNLSFADVLIDNATQVGIDTSGAGGVLNLGNVDITNFGGSVGVWSENASADISFASLDITGSGAAGSRGVDITGSTGSLMVTNGGVLQDLETGFELDRLGTGTTNASLSFQGGSINAGVPVNTVGITAGSYDFTGTTMIKNNALSTATGFGGDFWFADATGGGTGTSTDRASIDFVEANSADNDIIVLVEDGTGNITASNGLQLKNSQQLVGFATGDATVDFTGSNANVLGTFTYLISDPTGNGAATLSNSGGTEVVTLADNTKLRDFDLTTTGAVDGIAGNGFSDTTITNLAITNAGAEAFDFTNAAGTVTVTDSSATNSTGAGLRLNGGNATVALNNFDISDSGSGRSLDISATTGGSVVFDANSTISNSGGTGVLIDNIGGDVTFNGAVSVTSATTTALTITNLNTNAVTFNAGLGTVSTTAGTAINASGGTLNIAGTTNIIATGAQALAFNNLIVGDGSGGALSFGNISSGGGANGIALTNVTATNGLTITNATLANNTTAGLNINGVTGTLDIAAANIDGAAAATGLAIAGSNGTINIGSGGTGLDIDGGTTGVSINQTSGSVNLGSGGSGVFAIDGTSGNGVTLAGTGTVNIGTGGGSASIGATSDTGSTAFAVSGGSVDATYAGSIDLASNVGLVSVLGGHSGTLTFSGALSNSAATTATQLNFNNADGTYNFDGTVNANTTGGTGIGINVTATSGGTLDFDNSLTLATASGNAIQMAGTGSLNVNGGNLDIVTTSGAGFSATGGGTVNVSGANNSIVTTTGTALSIVNTTIGASGLTFRSISADGAVNGIVLNNTGTSGGLSVTGDGTNNGSGGTIQNTTAAGISLTNTHDVSLSSMVVDKTVGHNIGLSNVSGVINISNNTLRDANEPGGGDFIDQNNGIDIANTSGTITSLTITNNDIRATAIDMSDVGIALHIDGTAALNSATISQNTIQGHDYHAVRVSLDNDDSGDAPVAVLDIVNNALLSSEANAVDLNARGASDLTLTVSNNAQISSDFGSGIHVNAGEFFVGGDSTATVSGSILNNTIIDVGDGVSIDRGIDILTQESTTAVVNIDGNDISNVTHDGIALRVRDASSLDAVVNNNTLTDIYTSGSVQGLFAETRETSSGCFAITNNTNALTYQLIKDAGTVFNLEPLVGNTGTVNTTGTITNVSAGTCQRVP